MNARPLTTLEHALVADLRGPKVSGPRLCAALGVDPDDLARLVASTKAALGVDTTSNTTLRDFVRSTAP